MFWQRGWRRSLGWTCRLVLFAKNMRNRSRAEALPIFLLGVEMVGDLPGRMEVEGGALMAGDLPGRMEVEGDALMVVETDLF